VLFIKGDVKLGLRKDLVENQDYILIHKEVYDKLKGWYGVDF